MFGTHDFGGFGGCLGHMILVASRLVFVTHDFGGCAVGVWDT